VPFAESTGAIKAVTGAVLELVLDQVVRWREVGVDVPVAVNVSAYDVNDPNFADRVAQLLASRGLDGSSLVVELTETALLADPDAASVVLWRLAQMGVRVAIDDFGSGYASLLYLRRFPVSVLKLDRSLVQGPHRRPHRRGTGALDHRDGARAAGHLHRRGRRGRRHPRGARGPGLRPGAGLLPAGPRGRRGPRAGPRGRASRSR
jgi:EAL domain-containing protein (putative c-di-GMP-specific phosphodiesterase class I)